MILTLPATAELAPPNSVDVLHVVYQYTPEPLGGTEVYVQSLVHEASSLGLRCAIAAPGARNEHYQVAGIRVYRVAANVTINQVYGEENCAATARWLEVLELATPRILHIHARTPMLNSVVLRHARRLGIKVVYTVHTPTAFCQRGTMLEFGIKPCDGLVTLARCTQCTLQGLGVPKLATQILAHLPDTILHTASKIVPKKIAFMLTFRARIRRSQQEQSAFFDACDHIIAVCVWIEDALKINGVASTRLSLNRQGLRSDMQQTSLADQATRQKSLADQATRQKSLADQATRQTSLADQAPPLKVFALGRCDPNKGFDILIMAIKRCKMPIELDLSLGISNDQDRILAERFKQMAPGLGDSGALIRIHVNLSGAPLLNLFQQSDVLAVPSIWMETGPLVVLEAFSQRLPVIGSRRGGIAELVTHEKNGWLVPAGDVEAWANALDMIASDRGKLANACATIGAVRSMKEVALEHWSLYEKVLVKDNFDPSQSLPTQSLPPSKSELK